jgi:hypothetical protein
MRHDAAQGEAVKPSAPFGALAFCYALGMTYGLLDEHVRLNDATGDDIFACDWRLPVLWCARIGDEPYDMRTCWCVFGERKP